MKIILKKMPFKLYDFFPVRSNEYIKFFLLTAIAFLVCTNYTLLRTVKETLVITKPEMDIQIIPFLRMWMLMPIMFMFIKLYAVLSARFRQQTVCYFIISIFLIFYTLFTFIFYPYEENFRLERLGQWVTQSEFPFAGQFGAMLTYWSLSTYYCFSEVWGTIVVLILFWGVSNRINTLEQAKRCYSPILLITNLSGLFASQISLYVSHSPIKYVLFANEEKWSATLLTITLFVCLSTVCVLCLFFCLFRHIQKNQTDIAVRENNFSKSEMSLTNIFKVIAKQQVFLSLAIMVFAYFFASGILEFIWKFYLKKIYPDSNDFNDYLSKCTSYISIASTVLAIGVTGNLIRRFSWRLSARITPIILTIPVLGMIFVSYYYDADPMLSAFWGSCYYCLNRICKFTFFDLSKEIAMVEMSYADQIKSKTVIDGLMPKIGKTSESALLQILLISFSSFSIVIPSILILMLILHGVWAYFLKEKRQKKLILDSTL
jgi:ATP:ADP antiporter, AAA family